MKKTLKNIMFFVLDILFVLIIFYVLSVEIKIFINYWGTEMFLANDLCLLAVLSLVRGALLKCMPSRVLEKTTEKNNKFAKNIFTFFVPKRCVENGRKNVSN